ncbi:MAG: LysR family transcriptional regulator [Sinimarinibacterium sp.]|jgi:DNA-binding transcriptional LysR family regulator
MKAPKITLEQWRALVSVVDSGGYAQAAEHLHKTQSTVTYAVQKLEQLLGVKVFEIQGRKAVLTPVGEVLVRRGRVLIDEAAQLEQVARELSAGWEPELRLAVDAIFPTWLLLQCFAEFSAEHPDTRIELIESVLSGTTEALLEGRAQLAICSALPAGFLGDVLMQVPFVPVAHPDHPLHQLGRPLTREDLRQHRHLVIRDSGSQRDRNPVWLGERRWTVSHKATSIRAACMGLGFAWYAEHIIRDELKSGQLKPLPMAEGARRHATLYIVHADRDAAGPGIRKLAEIIRRRVQTCIDTGHAEASPEVERRSQAESR